VSSCWHPRIHLAVQLPFALLYMYYDRLKRRLLLCILLNVRYCVDSIPSALTILNVVSITVSVGRVHRGFARRAWPTPPQPEQLKHIYVTAA